MWICQCSAYFKFIPYAHTHTHTLIPFEDHEPTGLKVDIAHMVCSLALTFVLASIHICTSAPDVMPIGDKDCMHN